MIGQSALLGVCLLSTCIHDYSRHIGIHSFSYDGIATPDSQVGR